jgi:hypothetical protein
MPNSMAQVTCRTPGDPQPYECDWTRVEVARSIGIEFRKFPLACPVKAMSHPTPQPEITRYLTIGPGGRLLLGIMSPVD